MLKRVKRLVKASLDKYFKVQFEQIHEALESMHRELDSKIIRIQEKIDHIHHLTDQNVDLLMAQRENNVLNREKLEKLRKTENYKQAISKKEPLVSVRIATYNRAKLLTERALPSVLKQTYQNFEIVVVGDHCTDDTEERIKKLNDSRIRFHNLSQRTYYPEDKFKRWLVIGAPPANKAVELSRGEWIATLDDDDEFRPNHLETLVKLAEESKCELVYSALLSTHSTSKTQKIIWSNPPTPGKISMMSALYLRELYDIFKTDEEGWVSRLPQDWYLLRRMLMAGVSYAATEKITGDINLLTYEEKKDI